jgi:hypothetical protein
MCGDGSPEGTWMRVADPWPAGRGERYLVTFADLAAGMHAASALAGADARILHARKGARGTRSIEEHEVSWSFDQAPHVEAYPSPRFGTPVGLFRLYSGEASGLDDESESEDSSPPLSADPAVAERLLPVASQNSRSAGCRKKSYQ